MPRQRTASTLSSTSNGDNVGPEQELGSMYDYLAKIILIGPSGCGKSCLLHRFIRDEWRIYTSQTIGVEFASKIVKVGTGGRRRRIKLQLWDTAGTERFRSVSRSYYRGAAGAILVYDISSIRSFNALPTFLHDARALGSRQLVLLLAGNKSDLTWDSTARDRLPTASPPASPIAKPAIKTMNSATILFNTHPTSAETASREVEPDIAASWAQRHAIHTAVEVSALSGDGVDELFSRLAATILTRIELGEIDPDDPASGLQYGDSTWDDGQGSTRSTRRGGSTWMGGEWEDVFRVSGGRRRGCC